jgi:hypothetical protein
MIQFEKRGILNGKHDQVSLLPENPDKILVILICLVLLWQKRCIFIRHLHIAGMITEEDSKGYYNSQQNGFIPEDNTGDLDPHRVCSKNMGENTTFI